MDYRLTAFLSLIGWSEFTSRSTITQNNGYDIIVTGLDGPSRFDDYSDHPFAPHFNRPPVQWKRNPDMFSTAAGRYQILYRFWAIYKVQLGLANFGPAAQDQVALQLIKECHAVPLIISGDVAAAITACSSRWASFPGNNYGQHSHDMDSLLAQYQELEEA
jgi:muramidase (phage lysozyme)